VIPLSPLTSGAALLADSGALERPPSFITYTNDPTSEHQLLAAVVNLAVVYDVGGTLNIQTSSSRSLFQYKQFEHGL